MSHTSVHVHVEVDVSSKCFKPLNEVISLCESYLKQNFPVFSNGPLSLDQDISSIVNSAIVCDLQSGQRVSFWQAELLVHAFRLSEELPEKEMIESNGDEELPAASQWELPNKYLQGLWDAIVIEEDIKRSLLGYCATSLRFADVGVDSTIISWNRMILLHGPPGTGKTTICKALAQKVFIRNSDRYESGLLLEINSHSLFSKWFSESGKLVMKLFDHIAETAEDPDRLVFVLIDEVESIASARSSSMSSNEPGDAVRVVNAVLTSLDALKRLPNVLVLCTSNMVDAIDPAFRDRVDMMIYLGPPDVIARYAILYSCVTELMRCGIISPPVTLDEGFALSKARGTGGKAENAMVEGEEVAGLVDEVSRHNIAEVHTLSTGEMKTTGRHSTAVTVDEHLYRISLATEGMSGRALRKLFVRAHAMHIPQAKVTLEKFMIATEATITSNFFYDPNIK